MAAIPTRSNSEGIRQSKAAQRELMETGNRFRERHAWMFKHQDAIGFGIFAFSGAMIIAGGIAYWSGMIPAWVAILSAAFWMSLLHELEHDLIHYMYYRKNAFMHHLMMAGVWLFRPSTISPWVRRKLHLHHHKFSGTEGDLEERGITNGTPWGLKRLLMVGDHMLAVYLRPFETMKMIRAYVRSQGELSRAERRAIVIENATGYFPLGILHYGLWHGLVVWTVSKALLGLAGVTIELGETAMMIEQVVQFLAVTWLIPNVLRVFCLHLVSSNMHYYGDVEPGNIIQQTQVWRAWWLAPLHAFCFNFGATHAIHHFVVRDPFYVRQLTAKDMYPILAKYGVRFNDFGTFRRANRLAGGESVTMQAPTATAVSGMEPVGAVA